MAILKNLIVNGASRFLQKAYFDDIAVSALTVSGTSTFNGTTLLKGTTGIYGSTPTLNFHFGNSSNVTSYIQETPSGTLNISNNFNVKGSTTVKGITASGTATVSQLVVNNTSNFGGKVKVDGDVDIIGNLRWSTIGEHMTIQNLGGTLLVAPTIYQTTNTTVQINSISGTTVKFTIGMTNGTSEADAMIAPSGVTSDTTNNTFITGGANWRKLSLVKVSGKIGECVLGASDGTIENINVQNHLMTISATIANASYLQSGTTYPTSELSDFAVMLYKLHNGTNLFPIGIVLTSYGSDRKSYIDVYSGMNADPVARMGNLGGLTYKDYSSNDSGNDTTLTNQWGFYTKNNAYFEGKLETNSGKIGGWVITSTNLHKGAFGTEASSIYLIPDGSIDLADIGGSGNITGWAITSRNTFGVTIDGKAYMSDGKIAGWNITSTGLSYIPDNNHTKVGDAGTVFLIPGGSDATNGTASIGGSNSIPGWTITSGSTFGVTTGGAMYCTSGRIAGWSIQPTYIGKGTIGVDTSDGQTKSMFLSPDGIPSDLTIGGSTGTNSWCITSGNTFGVTNQGKLYCTHGEIGAFKIDKDSIFCGTKWYPKDSQTQQIPADSGDIRLSTTNFGRTIGSQTYGDLRFAIGSNFGVSVRGNVYMSNGYITGKITSDRTFRIRGEQPANYSAVDGYSPHSFDFIRAAAASKNGKTYRNIGIGPAFLEADDTMWDSVRPQVGISMEGDQFDNSDRIYIHSKFIYLVGTNTTTQPTFTNVRIPNGQLDVLGTIKANSFVYYDDGGIVPKSMAIVKNTIYTLLTSHTYLLIIWHDSYSTTGAWIIRGGTNNCVTLNSLDPNGNTCGENISIELETVYNASEKKNETTLMFMPIGGSPNPVGRLIDLG